MGLLTYYKMEANREKKKRGAITLSPQATVTVDASKACTFYLKPLPQGRVYHFTTDNEFDCKEWVDQIREACQTGASEARPSMVKDSQKVVVEPVDETTVLFDYLIKTNRTPPPLQEEQKLEQCCSSCKSKKDKLAFCRLCGNTFCHRCTAALGLPPAFMENVPGQARVCYTCEVTCRFEAKVPVGGNVVGDSFEALLISPPHCINKATFKTCTKCFNQGRNGHNCRFCGLLFCDKCTLRQPVPEAFEKNLVDKWRNARVCDRCRFLVGKGAKLHAPADQAALAFQENEQDLRKLGKELDGRLMGKLEREVCAHCFQKLNPMARRRACAQCNKQFCGRCIKDHLAMEQRQLASLSPTNNKTLRPQLRRQVTTRPNNMIGAVMTATMAGNPNKALAQLAAMSKKHISRGQRAAGAHAATATSDGLSISVAEAVTPRARPSETVDNMEPRASLEPGAETDFEILCRLGEGSYGTVYKALDKRTNRLVAIKVIEDQSEPDKIDELMNEVKFMAECADENLVAYGGTFLMGERTCIAMEYCCAGALTDIMEVCERTFEEKEIAIIMREALKGLSYMHKHFKIHRDIKAANILLTERGECKLADFGVSCRLASAQDRRKTMIGTPYWMAPEVLQAKENNGGYDVKADVWSLGVTALELAKGLPPMADVHPMRAIYKIPFAPPPALPDPEAWSPEFVDFIAQCVNKDQAARLSAEQLLQHPFIVSAGPLSVMAELVSRVLADIDEFRAREQQKAVDSDEEEDDDDASDMGSSTFSRPTLDFDSTLETPLGTRSLERPRWDRGTSQIESELRKVSDCSYRHNHI